MTEDQIAECRRMRDAGMNWNAMAKAIGCDPLTVRRALDEGWAVRRRQKVNEARRQRTKEKPSLRKIIDRDTYTISAKTRADAERLMRQIPHDTRSLTGRMLGDPIPGRSALDMRRGA